MKQSFLVILASIGVMGMSTFKTFTGDTTSVRIVNSENPLVTREISSPVKQDPSFKWAPLSGSVELGDLKQRSGTEPLMLTIGNGVAAGYRNGGLFRQGQLTSYPNLVAKQMGLVNFNQALFEKEEGNGTGFIINDESSTVPRWSKVVNNLSVSKDEAMVMKPYLKGLVHNLSVPGNHPNKYFINPVDEIEYTIAFKKKTSEASYENNANFLWTSNHLSTTLLSRIVQKDEGSVWDYLNKMKPDVAIVDINLDVYKNIHMHGGQPGIFGNRESFWEVQILDYLKKNGTKYVYMTLPDVLDFPYFKWYNFKSLKDKNGGVISILKDGSPFPIDATEKMIFLPTSNVVNIYNGISINSILSDADVITEDEASRPEFYNEEIVKWSKVYNYPLVDFYAIYKKILAGNYISDDGYKIDPTYGTGNFFSADGMYPSAIGQAILANEVIKVMNSNYHSRIPLINISLYAKEMLAIQ